MGAIIHKKSYKMKILLSPSESKQDPVVLGESSGGDTRLIDDVMWGGQAARNANIHAYLSILQNASDAELCKVFGTKSVSLETLRRCGEILDSPRVCAIELYNGVAYKALNFAEMDSRAKEFVLESVLIMSNLFGLVRASDRLPFYHLNQNYKSKLLSLRALYQAQEEEIDKLLATEQDGVQNGVIVDLRAQIYSKAYPIKQAHYVLNLPSKVSHQAKLHRGLALRELALCASIQDVKSRHNMLRQYLDTHCTYCTP